ncbi:peptidase [Campylobacterota bacterium]|nr:peptidase [Campylobacterota bacterium]
MNKLLAFFALAVFAFAASESDTLTEIYLSGGSAAVHKRADEIVNNALVSQDFWRRKIDKLQTRLGYYENPKHLFVVDKAAKKFYLFNYNGGNLTREFEFNATMGDAIGDKYKEGDNKTPVGSYEIKTKLKQGERLFDPYYGPLAYVSNYPNSFDKSLKKTGHGIWVHGFPLSGTRENENTKGCVAIDNSALLLLDKVVNAKNVELLINEKGILEADKNDLSLVLALLYKWRQTWKTNDIERYLSLYAEDFARNDGVNKAEFARLKRQIFGRGEQKKIVFSDVEVVPYPNSLGSLIYKVRFWQDYEAATHRSKRVKELYLRKKDDRFEIILED